MWNIDFEHQYDKRSGATEEQMARFVEEWNAELSAAEMEDIKGRQVNPFHKTSPFTTNIRRSILQVGSASAKFSASYLDLLKYSNGGEFQQENVFSVLWHG